MTRIEKANLLAELKLTLLEAFDTVEEAKSAKKQLTKFVNTYIKHIYKLGEPLKEFTNEANKDFSYDDKSELKSAVWSFHSVHPFAKSIIELPQALEIIENVYPSLYIAGLKFYNEVKEEATYLIVLENHIVSELSRFKGTTAQQFLLLASKSSEISREKKEAFAKYASSLGKWKQSTIQDAVITVNGTLYNEGDVVGVMIGRGNRVHAMTLSAGRVTDKETKEVTEVIYISNHTQWRNSDLVILDYLKNIPSELMSERM